MMDYVLNGSNMTKALFLMGAGIGGVFLVLVLFYLLIRLLLKLFPERENTD